MNQPLRIAGSAPSLSPCHPVTLSPCHHRPRRGAILIAAIFITTILASLVIIFCHSMRTEALASANDAAAIQASAIARGAEQYVLAALVAEGDAIRTLGEEAFAAVPVGDGFFWVLRPDYGDESEAKLGLGDEAAKVNLNTATYNELLRLPLMNEELADAIIDWRDADSTPRANGAEDEYYGSLRPGYRTKNGPFDTVEELLMVRGFTPEILYGEGGAGESGIGAFGDHWAQAGIFHLLTVYSREPAADPATAKININNRSQRQRLTRLLQEQLNASRGSQIVSLIGPQTFTDIFDFHFRVRLTQAELVSIIDSVTAALAQQQQAQAQRALINVNTAPREVLLALGLAEEDVEKLLTDRKALAPDSTAIAWVAESIGEKAIGLGNRITGRSYQWSAEVLAVSGNGRAFRRCRVIIDLSQATPRIVYRRDLTEKGWPLDQQILESLRRGDGLGGAARSFGGTF